MAAATCFVGSWGSKAKKSTAPCGRKWPKTDAKRNALPRAGVAVYHAAFTAALLTLCMRARSWILALDYFA